MRPTLILGLALAFAPTHAPADGTRGAAAPCVEVVTFRLVAGADAAVTEVPLRGQPGFLRRRLVQSADGTWTDWVEWRDMPSAQAAAEAMMAAPAFGPFMALIDPDSVVMRHDMLTFAMD